MGKQGPCYHCGVQSTPLWRNGPPEKPVLCNACGSRWRTKGSLVNYTPLHARDEFEIEDLRAQKIPKRIKSNQEHLLVNNSFKKKAALDEEGSNRSSSGSVVSISESCDQWETTFLHKKRMCLSRPKAVPASASVEKLTKDLYSILQDQQSSWISGCSEEDLLFENETPMLIGHGSVLMRDSHSGDAPDEESEASSKSSSKATKQEQLERAKTQVLGRHSLPLCNIDLKEQRKDIKDSVGVSTSDNNSLVLRSPEEVMKIRSNHIETTKESLENKVSSLKTMINDGSVMFSYEDNDNSEQDLLLDLPSNGSYPQAELLHMI